MKTRFQQGLAAWCIVALLFAAVLLAAGCAAPARREGPVLPVTVPQAADQCDAQHDLDWCPK